MITPAARTFVVITLVSLFCVGWFALVYYLAAPPKRDR